MLSHVRTVSQRHHNDNVYPQTRADMNPKMVLTVIGSFQVALAGGIFFNAGALASEGISEISDQALWLASQFVEVMAAMSLGTGIVYLFSRDIEISAAKKVLTGAGISYLIMVALMIFHLINNADKGGGKPPVPLMIIFPILAIWSLYAANFCSTEKDPTE